MKRRDFLTAGSLAMATAMVSPQLFAVTKDKPLQILALVFDDYETLDLHGPVEMLGHMKNVQIKLVGDKSIIRSYQGPKVVTDVSMDSVIPIGIKM